MPPQNQAAWLTAAQTKPLQVGPAPYPTAGPGEIIVKNGAVAINPIDWQKQLLGDVLLSYIAYPFILGGDVAGTVVETGPGVARFRVGDRVVGAALAIAESVNNPAEGGFQLYTVLRQHMAAPLPDSVTDEQACVIPLTLCTAAYGLFHLDLLGLDMPTVPARSSAAASGSGGGPVNDGPNAEIRAVIVAGGSTSVGSNAVQLAVAAGYEVISTASPKNFEYVRKLGASHVFDYWESNTTLVNDILVALGGRSLAGALAIGHGAVELCGTVMERHPEKTNKFVATVNGVPEGGAFAGVEVKFVDLRDACDPDGHVARIWMDFLPRALSKGQFVPAPVPLVVGKRLDSIQEAMDLQMKGVSAQKVVVSL